MPPRPTPSRTALDSAYYYNGQRPVAYLDETYRVERGGPIYYVMTAAVIQSDQRDIVRYDIQEIVGSTYWHTTEALQDAQGTALACDLLDYLGDPAGTEACFIAHEHQVQPTDPHGEHARSACLSSLLCHLNRPLNGGIELFILEKRLTARMTNQDARTKNHAITDGLISPGSRLFQTSPSDENLLWIPDLVCSAYRQQITGRRADLFQRISAMCTILP